MLNSSQHILDYVDDYYHQLLDDDDNIALKTHCEKCEICQAALTAAEKRFQLFQSAVKSEASQSLVANTLQKIERRNVRLQKIKRFTRYMAYITAATVLIIAGFQIHFALLKPTPFDLRLLGQNNWIAGSTTALRLAMFDLDNNLMIDDVPITITLASLDSNRSMQLLNYRTKGNQSNSPRFKIPDWEPGQYELRITANPTSGEETLIRHIKIRRSWKLMLSSDKPVYQPGQTIHLRSLALLRSTVKPVVGQKVTFSITDPKGNVIFKQNDLTSKYGISSSDCALATKITQGNYEITCQVGETISKRTVSVKKYVLPKFKIKIELDKPYYQPGQIVKGTLQADYFFGKPVAAGKVTLKARGDDFQSEEFEMITTTTNKTGLASFRFVLPNRLVGRENFSGNAHFQLEAKVVDAAGQTYETSISKIVTNHPIQLEVITESGRLVLNISNRIYLYASYADGRPAEVRIQRENGNTELKTNSLGVTSFDYTPTTKDVSFLFKATDNEGVIGRRTVDFTCGTAHDAFIVRPNRSVINSGETLQLTGLAFGNEPIFIDLLKENQTIVNQTLEMNNGRGSLAIDLPPDLFGTVQLVAYRFGDAGLIVRKTRTLYIRPANQLKIKLTLDKTEYRPGSKAKLRFTLTDQAGKPSPGAISLAAVDEAVFSVSGSPFGMEHVFFLLEKELLKPVYEIYDWSPNFTPEVIQRDRTDFEEALFSRTAVSSAEHVSNSFSLKSYPSQPVDYDMDPNYEDSRLSLQGSGISLVSQEKNMIFPLNATSFPHKLSDVYNQRYTGLNTVYIAWGWLAGIVVVIGLGISYTINPRVFTMFACGTAVNVVIIIGMIIPATQSATSFLDENSPDMEASFFQSDQVKKSASGRSKSDRPFDNPLTTGIPNLQDYIVNQGRSDPNNSTKNSSPQPRVRRWFPETLLWQAEVITDDNGVVEREIDLADSITTWRLSASAVNSQGQLGAGQFPIRVFQPFFVDVDLPVSLTRNDEVSLPVVVYNYSDKKQTIQINLKKDSWFELLTTDKQKDNTQRTVELAAGEVRSLSYRVKVLKVGQHYLQVQAIAGEIGDAVRREIEVIADGRRVQQIVSNELEGSQEFDLTIPQKSIEGSSRSIFKFYPNSFSQVIEGLDSIFKMPSGCFEQTSSTMYPNILALDYLRRTKQSQPAIEAKARQYLHVGYQRLVTFEVSGGGFSWYGEAPASISLTAYGLMEFQDMARLQHVDPKLIHRTRDWLMKKRASDGSWTESARMFQAVQSSRADATLMTTAYVAWAVYGAKKNRDGAKTTIDYITSRSAKSINDPYLLALVINALVALDADKNTLEQYIGRLDSLKKISNDGKTVWWEKDTSGRTTFYGSGKSSNIETTALAVLAMRHGKNNISTITKSLTWIIKQKDAQGTWYSTQATVLALKALLSGTELSLGGDKTRVIEITINGKTVRTITIEKDQSSVMQLVDLSNEMKVGKNKIKLTNQSDSNTKFQVVHWYHLPEDAKLPNESAQNQPFLISIQYDRRTLKVNDHVSVIAKIKNQSDRILPMVIIDLPIPGGFVIEDAELAELQKSGKIDKYEITARRAIVYLRQLEPKKEIQLNYRLKATMPVKVTVPAGRVYEYYDPANRSRSKPIKLEATPEA